MILLVSAFLLEALPLIRHFSLKKRAQKPFPLYQNGKIALVISGMGKEHMISSLSYLVGRFPAFSHLSNIGYAGHGQARLGTLYLAGKLEQKNAPPFYSHLRKEWGHIAASTLISVETPEITFSQEALYDMEGYAFFQTALRFTSLENISVWKVVSDGPNDPFKKSSALMEKAAPHLIICLEEMAQNHRSDFLQENSSLPPHIHFTATEKIQAKKSLLYAKELGIDTAPFFKTTSSHAFLKKVQQAIQASAPTYA